LSVFRQSRSFFITYGKPKALLEVMPRKGLVANPLYGFAYGNPAVAPESATRNCSGKPGFLRLYRKKCAQILKKTNQT
jgi:hypothetical protein